MSLLERTLLIAPITRRKSYYAILCKLQMGADRPDPLVQATGIASETGISNADSPWIHTSHDLLLEVMADQASDWLVVGGGGPGRSFAYKPSPATFLRLTGLWPVTA